MYWVVAIIALAAACAVGLRIYRAHTDGPNVSRSELKEWMDEGADVCIFDVRSAKEYKSGYIPGAINIGHKDIPGRLDELAPYKNRKIVVYCERGVRARIAQKALNKAGFSEVYHLTGDMAGWREARLPADTVSDE